MTSVPSGPGVRLMGPESHNRLTKRDLREQVLDRPDIRPRALASALVFIPAGSVLAVVCAIVALRYNAPAITISLFAVLISVFGFSAWLVAISKPNLGIRRTDYGLEVFQNSSSPEGVARFVIPWSEIEAICVYGGFSSGVVVLQTAQGPFQIDVRQARSVVTDPHWPRHLELSKEATQRLAVP